VDHSNEPVAERISAPAMLVLRRAQPRADLEAAIRLLCAAGRAEPYVRAWCDEGRVLCLSDVAADPGEDLVGAAIVVPLGQGATVEVRVINVAPGDEGLADRLLGDVLQTIRGQGARRVVASASSLDLALQASLQHVGFRPSHIERDGCRIDHGWLPRDEGRLSNRDLTWFELEL
jgi:hypothetical protein